MNSAIENNTVVASRSLSGHPAVVAELHSVTKYSTRPAFKVAFVVAFVAAQLCCVTGFSTKLAAQTLAPREAINDLQMVADQFRQQKLSYEITFGIYDQQKPSASPLEENKVQCYLWYPYTIYKYTDVEFYHNDKMKVAFYPQKKKVIVNKSSKKADQAMLSLQFDVDSLLKFYQKIELLKSEDGTRTYRITYKPQMEKYSHTDIAFDTRSYRVKQISVYYRKSMKEMYGPRNRKEDQQVVPRVDIVFSHYKVLQKNDWNLFGAGHIVQVKGSKVSLKPAYSGYELVNYYKAAQ